MKKLAQLWIVVLSIIFFTIKGIGIGTGLLLIFGGVVVTLLIKYILSDNY